MTRWQYKTFRHAIDRDVYLSMSTEAKDAYIDSWLNEIGEQGWEIVTFPPVDWQLCALMKRPDPNWAFRL